MITVHHAISLLYVGVLLDNFNFFIEYMSVSVCYYVMQSCIQQLKYCTHLLIVVKFIFLNSTCMSEIHKMSSTMFIPHFNKMPISFLIEVCKIMGDWKKNAFHLFYTYSSLRFTCCFLDILVSLKFNILKWQDDFQFGNTFLGA